MHEIKEILKIEGHILYLRFGNGELRQVDLTDKIREWGKKPGTKFFNLRDQDEFKQVKIEPEFEALVWENGIDLCPDVLYELSEAVENQIL